MLEDVADADSNESGITEITSEVFVVYRLPSRSGRPVRGTQLAAVTLARDPMSSSSCTSGSSRETPPPLVRLPGLLLKSSRKRLL